MFVSLCAASTNSDCCTSLYSWSFSCTQVSNTGHGYLLKKQQQEEEKPNVNDRLQKLLLKKSVFEDSSDFLKIMILESMINRCVSSSDYVVMTPSKEMCWFSIHFHTFRASVALRSSLITADNASGFIPCSQRRTQMERVSMSKPVFSICLLYTSPSPRD